MRRYQTPHALVPETGAVITDTLETIAREGARRMLEHALRAEVDERLGRARYERGAAFTGYRNGYARPREIGIGTWSVPIRAPRLSDLPPDEPPFESAKRGAEGWSRHSDLNRSPSGRRRSRRRPQRGSGCHRHRTTMPESRA